MLAGLKYMEISQRTLNIIAESLAFFYAETEKLGLSHRQKEIAEAVREVMDYQTEQKKKTVDKS